MKKVLLKLVFSLTLFLGASSVFAQQNEKQENQKPPTAAELIKQMDTNKDGKLSKKEIKGPLKDDFAKVDTNKDGFLSLKELNKAPKPERKKDN
ncbi:EF-hand domain-containing protein [Flavobacterium algicola]|uniref:EF-hand domain-containing protein n=1 Tax=Flavobacterium algicola TaxID=556529 RepID=UPI001EFDB04F|nr:EF-hand domain-containing protein [Flavobacterium algicola]MCG9791687.1 EF-hand domain-containing protein [Flavobacterium algicola]